MKFFGLNPNKVTSISFTVFPEDAVYVNVSEIVYEEEMKQMMEITKEFKLERTDKTSEITGGKSQQTFE